MISVLVVEDDPVAAQAHANYVSRVDGFEVAARVATAQEALRFLDRHHVDLLLLDLRLPDRHGLHVSRMLRSSGGHTDVIAVTSVRELHVVRESVASGVVQYLLKPFTFQAMREKLENYARFRASLADDGQANGQDEIDRAFSALRGVERANLPKGMGQETLAAVTETLRSAPGAMSAESVGNATGVSRVTARRYLEYLVDSGVVTREPQHGTVGRPELHYSWHDG